MKIAREWATPLTIGSFGLMATTGILMFFHLDSGLNKTAHEWLGWVMVAVVAAHGRCVHVDVLVRWLKKSALRSRLDA
jgi:cytochrome b561